MNSKEVSKYIIKLKTIKIGDKWEDIENLLGRPTLERNYVPKETNTVKGVFRLYNVSYTENKGKQKEGSVNLLFNTDGKLKSIIVEFESYKRIDGIKNQNRVGSD